MCSVTVEGRLAIRAARLRPEADALVRELREKSHAARNLWEFENMGSHWGPIRISLPSALFLFNVLALPSISSEPLKFELVWFRSPPFLPDFHHIHAFRKRRLGRVNETCTLMYSVTAEGCSCFALAGIKKEHEAQKGRTPSIRMRNVGEAPVRLHGALGRQRARSPFFGISRLGKRRDCHPIRWRKRW